MARYSFQGTARDGAGNVISLATISVFLNGTTTAASVYTVSAGGTVVNSVTSGTDGDYIFYVDTSDYTSSQKFKITIAKSGYSSNSYDDIMIYPVQTITTITSKMFGFNRIMSAASGDVTEAVAFGFIPTSFMFIVSVVGGSFAVGADDLSTAQSGWTLGSTQAPWVYSVVITKGLGDYQVAIVKSCNATSVTFTWTKVGDPSSLGTASIIGIAFA